MAPPVTTIASLTSQTKKATIIVRATRIWESFNSKTKKFMYTNVIFLDREDSHILAMVWKNQTDTYFPKIKEGSVYTISEFVVKPIQNEYISVDRDLCLNFYHRTKLEPTEDRGEIPQYKFELTELESVPALLWKVENFLDVIGLVDSYGTMEAASNGGMKLEVCLINQRKYRMMVTLWEARANQFLEAVTASNGSAAFVVITNLLCKKFSAKEVLSSSDGTKTYCNINYTPLEELKPAILAATGHTIQTLPPPTKARLITGATTPLEEVSIQHILDAEAPGEKEVIRYLCEAKIVDLSKHEGWFYNSCPNCPHHIEFRDTKFYCGRCVANVDTYTQRYRVNAVVQDTSRKTTFTLFNKEVERLIGVPIIKVISEIGQDKITDQIPPVLRNMVGRQCLFEVKATAYNEPGKDGFTVSRLSETPQKTPHTDDAGTSKKQRTA